MNDELPFWNFYFFCIWKVAARRSYSLSMKSERKTCRKLWNIACTIHQYHASLAKVRMAEESLKFFRYVKVRTVYTYTLLKTLRNIRICLLANILEFFKPPLYFTVHTWYCSSDQPPAMFFIYINLFLKKGQKCCYC